MSKCENRGRSAWAVVGASVALLSFAGCGDGDDDIASPLTTTADTGVTTTTTVDSRATTTTTGATTLRATLAPLNRSSANGTAVVELKDNRLAVTVNARNVSPMLAHAQHIHIGGTNACPSADAGNKTDPKDLIDTAEGQPAYGPVKVSLTSEGGVAEDAALAVARFPVADGSGNYSYARTFDLPAGTTMNDVTKGVLVVHGISKLFGDQAKYDGAAKSSLDPSLPLETTIPALCGRLQGA